MKQNKFFQEREKERKKERENVMKTNIQKKKREM
jgi:hypothetical protein